MLRCPSKSTPEMKQAYSGRASRNCCKTNAVFIQCQNKKMDALNRFIARSIAYQVAKPTF